MNCLSKHCLEHTLVPPKLTGTTLTLGFPCFSFSPLSFDTSPGQVPATGLNRSPTASLVSIKKKKEAALRCHYGFLQSLPATAPALIPCQDSTVTGPCFQARGIFTRSYVDCYIYIYIYEDAQVQWNSRRPLHYVFLLHPCQKGH